MNESHSKERSNTLLKDDSNQREPPGAQTLIQVVYTLYFILLLFCLYATKNVSIFLIGIYTITNNSFILAVTSLIGVIIAYAKRDDYTRTFYAEHLTWQIRTFWLSLLFGVTSFVGLNALSPFHKLLATFALASVLHPSAQQPLLPISSMEADFVCVAIFSLCFSVIWPIYRIVKGFLRANARKGFSKPKAFF